MPIDVHECFNATFQVYRPKRSPLSQVLKSLTASH